IERGSCKYSQRKRLVSLAAAGSDREPVVYVVSGDAAAGGGDPASNTPRRRADKVDDAHVSRVLPFVDPKAARSCGHSNPAPAAELSYNTLQVASPGIER